MTGYTAVHEKAILDWRHPTSANTQYVAYSANGTSETGSLARTAIGATGWAAATGGSPSTKANAAAITTAAATGAVTVTHFAVFTASSAGEQITDWQALAASRALVAGDTATWAAGALAITLD